MASSTGIENCHSSRMITSRVRAPKTLRRPISRVRRPTGQCGQPEQAQAGDQDGDGDEDGEYLALAGIAPIEVFISVIQEGARERDILDEGAGGAQRRPQRYRGRRRHRNDAILSKNSRNSKLWRKSARQRWHP